MMLSKNDYFDWVFWRLAWAGGSYWKYFTLEDNTSWLRIGLGFYWRVK